MPLILTCFSIVWTNYSSENLRLQRIESTVLVLIGAGLLMGLSRSRRTVEAESFILKGADGLIRAKMDAKDGLTPRSE